MSVTLKRYAPKQGQPQDDKLATCWTCGYQWPKGTHGGHSCAQTLSHTVERLERELQQATEKAACEEKPLFQYKGPIYVRPCERGWCLIDQDDWKQLEDELPEGYYIAEIKVTEK